jgi:hypothetical protein
MTTFRTMKPDVKYQQLVYAVLQQITNAFKCSTQLAQISAETHHVVTGSSI